MALHLFTLKVNAQDMSFLRVDGKNVVDAKGNPFYIQGTNLGNWLNPEGYMFGFKKTISAFMIAVGEFNSQKCTSKKVLEPLVVLIAPFAPHIAEELWEQLGHTSSVCDAKWSEFNEKFIKENSVTLSISFNGKTRFTMSFPVEATKEEIEKEVLAGEQAKKYIDGKQIVKVIVVPGRIVNIVVR